MTGGWRLVRARREAVPASVRRFALRARQRRLRAATPWFVGLALLALLAVVVGVVGFTSLFGVAHVKVDGVRVATADQVRAAAAVPEGTPLVRVSPGAVAKRVRALPPVWRVTVSRSWPRTLTIHVEERTAVAVVPVGGGFVALDGTGVAFEPLAARPAGLPLVRLATPSAGDPATRGALEVLRSLPAQLRGSLGTLVADGPARIKLELTDGRTVVWGDAKDNEIKARVAVEVLARPEMRGRAQAVLDVSAPYVPTIR